MIHTFFEKRLPKTTATVGLAEFLQSRLYSKSENLDRAMALNKSAYERISGQLDSADQELLGNIENQDSLLKRWIAGKASAAVKETNWYVYLCVLIIEMFCIIIHNKVGVEVDNIIISTSFYWSCLSIQNRTYDNHNECVGAY